MYLYFDSNGTLKEQINDVALRQGNANINKLYVFWEKSVNNQSITGLWARYKADDGSYYPSSSTYQETNTTTNAQIPYDKNRDLKYFNYWTTYKFYVVSIPNDVLSVGGNWLCSLWFVEGSDITTLSNVAFYVEDSNMSIKIDENINVAQWNSLMSAYSGLESDLNGKQDELTFDNTPTEDSDNPVTSDGIYQALANKQDTLTFDDTPTYNSNNPVKSGGIYNQFTNVNIALAGKQATLLWDETPTENSPNPVKSGGIYTALSGKQDNIVWNTTYNSSTNKGATMNDVNKMPNTYRHIVTLGFDGENGYEWLSCVIVNNSSTAFTESTFRNYVGGQSSIDGVTPISIYVPCLNGQVFVSQMETPIYVGGGMGYITAYYVDTTNKVIASVNYSSSQTTDYFNDLVDKVVVNV